MVDTLRTSTVASVCLGESISRVPRSFNHDIDVFPAEHQTVTFVGRPSLWRKPMIISLGYDDGDLPSVYLAST
ncbi:hypothetical protein ARMSODRAFT_963732 [Armillaria solidipes]|uniref:Uncharacterized protein n=1 Tax=Armillaria solidipes TaxID=1076256 RepID=A0A2H3BGD5_9AGAR|nr:hypothetical protein ARMSODRAFT_963732 [Armillaria solidipes]